MRCLFFFIFSTFLITNHCWATASISHFLGCDSVKIQSKKPLPLCEGDSTELSISYNNKNATYRWLRDGINLNISTSVLKIVKKSGLYKVIVTDGSVPCMLQDSIKVVVLARPPATLTASGPTNICANDTLKLSATKGPNYDYLWLFNEIPLVDAVGSDWRPKKTGTYAVIVTDTSSKCSTKSEKKSIVIRPVPVVTLDSIPPICGGNSQAITLNGLPTGGIYSGRGVVENKFLSLSLPVANYGVTYSFTNTEGCSNRTSRTIVVAPPPLIQIPHQLVIQKGESIEINSIIPKNSTVVWSPTTGLSDPKNTNPIANPLFTTIYQVKVTTKEGCHFFEELKIVVVDLKIPNGFSPNGDGINDKWEIGGISAYPNCVIEIYNRWGNVVFTSKGYNAEWEGDALPLGVYYYSVYLREISYKLSGEVLIMR
jgi:gliding motility-associated-like protein